MWSYSIEQVVCYWAEVFRALIGSTVRTAGVKRQALAYALALLACLVAGIVGVAHVTDGNDPRDYSEALLGIVPLVAGSVAAALLVSRMASYLGRRPKISGAAVAGLGFALTLPAQTAVVPATIAMGFGWIVGREVFGNLERSFVHPAVLAHVFLALTWPQSFGTTSLWLPRADETIVPLNELWLLSQGGAIGASSGVVCLLCALGLVALGCIPWRILLSVPMGMALGLGLLGRAGLGAPDLPLSSHLILGSVLFGVIFLATDPHSSPASNAGRWAHGMLIGFLIILLRLANTASPDGTMSAILIASIFAPLFDHAAVAGGAKRLGVEA